MTDKSKRCHLFIMLASEVRKAVIFRHGPHQWTEIILWDTQADTFTEGQWFKGTLYHKRCDLSPDGTKMIYFAAKHYKAYSANASYPDTWTAVSRPPYLTTLATAKTHGTYDGGGYFGDNNTVYVNQSRYVPDENNVPPLVIEKINVAEGVEFKPIALNGRFYYEDNLYYDILLERWGWRPIQSNTPSNTDQNPAQWRKDNRSHTYGLLMAPLSGFGRGQTWQFNLKHHQDKIAFKVDSDEWADWDQQGRLVYTRAGKLFVGNIRAHGIDPVELADFNPNKVRLIESPAWARTWDQY